jgi:transposase
MTPETFVEILATLRLTNAELAATIATQRRDIVRLVKMVEGLTKQLDALLGEQAIAERAELARLRQAAVDTAPPAEGGDAPPGGRGAGPDLKPALNSRRSKHGRGPIPAAPTRDIHKMKPGKCDRCHGDSLAIADTQVTEEWDYVKAHLRIRRTERTTCVCTHCNARVTPLMPPMPFERAACTFGLLAWLLYMKCGLFVPLDRLVRELARQGATIPSPTLTRWWGRGADLLLPIAASVRLSLLEGSHVRMDGTGLRVIFPRMLAIPVKGDARHGATDPMGRLVARAPISGQILVFGDDEHAVYHFTLTKEGRHALDFFTTGNHADGRPILWRGTITADAAGSQDCLFTSGDRIEAGCNSHGLRKFRDDADKAPLLAARAMGFIGRVYDIEGEARTKKMLGAQLLSHRREHAGPIVAEFRVWIDAHLTDLLPSNPVRKAIQYYVNHWAALTRFLHDPDVPLDNNWSERALRKVAMIRNNSMFAGGEEGALRLCTVFTLVQTCALLGVDACAYLEWALQRVVPHLDNRGIVASDLTPAAYKTTQK